MLIASFLVSTTDAHEDYFRADRAWFYIVLLSIGYMVSRGLAKAGSRHHDDAKLIKLRGGSDAVARLASPQTAPLRFDEQKRNNGRGPPLPAQADAATWVLHAVRTE